MLIFFLGDGGTMNENNRTTSMIGVFLVGASLGAIAALLFAPKTGKETRRLISRKAEESADYVTAKSRELRQQAEDFVEKGFKTAERLADRGRSIADRVV
jgi:gas vesicle protein